jgi:hypothetical protein
VRFSNSALILYRFTPEVAVSLLKPSHDMLFDVDASTSDDAADSHHLALLHSRSAQGLRYCCDVGVKL